MTTANTGKAAGPIAEARPAISRLLTMTVHSLSMTYITFRRVDRCDSGNARTHRAATHPTDSGAP